MHLDEKIEQYAGTESQLQEEYEELKKSGPGNVVLTEDQEAEYEQVRNNSAVASAKPRQNPPKTYHF